MVENRASGAVNQFALGRSAVTPVQKVIQLMEGMMTKGKEEKQAEVVQFAAYKQFCEGTSAEKQSSIAKAEETIETLKADIEKYMATAARLGKEIAAHDEDISVWTGDIKAATKVREMEKNDYDAMHKDADRTRVGTQQGIYSLRAVQFCSGVKLQPMLPPKTIVAFNI